MKENVINFNFKWTQLSEHFDVECKTVVMADNVEEAKRLFYNSIHNAQPNSVEIQWRANS